MEIEIALDTKLDDATIFNLEMHSFLNVLSVLSGIMQYFKSQPGCDTYFTSEIDQIHQFVDAIDYNKKELVTPEALNNLKMALIRAMDTFRIEQKDYAAGGEYAELTDPLDEVLAVMDVRIAELKVRNENPDEWKTISVDDYTKEFEHFFLAVQKNSLGRYRIIHNLADRTDKDYLVNLKIDSDTNNAVPLTLLFKDVIRDVTANARKYTAPGGEITIGISYRKGKLRFVCEDSGIGIPEDEIQKVVGFQYRASNVDNKIRTMGNGSGLTKAGYVTQKLGGRMWIDSELGKGTRITIEIPVPPQAFGKTG
ncbi:MAG: ATP-binding protein [Bacteroidetes bacterium]|nr:ATP-binding protein [Bacteroidota bacterium]MCH8523962.1 ATP-binding protein [Balneolales bacterium]